MSFSLNQAFENIRSWMQDQIDAVPNVIDHVSSGDWQAVGNDVLSVGIPGLFFNTDWDTLDYHSVSGASEQTQPVTGASERPAGLTDTATASAEPPKNDGNTYLWLFGFAVMGLVFYKLLK